MTGLDDLRAFEKVASLNSFSAAARLLALPKSSISRSVRRLESEFGVRLFQRTTRDVVLTRAGAALRERFADILERADLALALAAGFRARPGGDLKMTSGIGFGSDILAELIPKFAKAYPDIRVSLELTSRSVDLVAEDVDIAVRMGPLQDSQLISTRLGALKTQLCTAPAYLERCGRPATLDDLREHALIEMPRLGGRPRTWRFSNHEGADAKVEVSPRISVNDPHTIHRMLLNGGGVGTVARYLCTPDLEAGRLVRLFPDWDLPSVDVTLVFPSSRELAPAVRAFVEFMRSDIKSKPWLDD